MFVCDICGGEKCRGHLLRQSDGLNLNDPVYFMPMEPFTEDDWAALDRALKRKQEREGAKEE